MDLNDTTTEKIRKRFDNQFDLVSYAIELARNMIETGRDSRVKIDSENPALRVIAEISSGKDYFEEKVIRTEEVRSEAAISFEDEPAKSEKKKNRKILIGT